MNDDSDRALVAELGGKIGYGRIMELASDLWGESLVERGLPDGGQFVLGACKAMTVACGCESPKDCGWCCGTGRLTRAVYEMIYGG